VDKVGPWVHCTCGRPALPTICRHSLRSYSLCPEAVPASLFHRRVPLMTTKCAGRFMPSESVEVVQITCASSTSSQGGMDE
jgi:hypothetical protein